MPRGIESYVSGAQIVRQGVNAKSIVERKLRGKVMLLDNPQKSNSLSVGSKGGASAERKRKGRKAEERARKKRCLNGAPAIESADGPPCTRENAAELQSMWTAYVEALLDEQVILGSGKHKKRLGTVADIVASSRLQSRVFLQNIDLHGCRLKLLSCENSKRRVGAYGYLVGETRNALRVGFEDAECANLTEDIIGKKNTSFTFTVKGLEFRVDENVLARRIL